MTALSLQQQSCMIRLQQEYRDEADRLRNRFIQAKVNLRLFEEMLSQMPEDKPGLTARMEVIKVARKYWEETPLVQVSDVETRLLMSTQDFMKGYSLTLMDKVRDALDIFAEIEREERERWMMRLTEEATNAAKRTDRLTETVTVLTGFIAGLTFLNLVLVIVSVLPQIRHAVYWLLRLVRGS